MDGPGSTARDDRPRQRDAILIAEDDDLIRELCEIVLRDLGGAITTASTAIDACAALDADPSLAVLVTDVSMPGERSGTDLIRHAIATRPELGIVVISGLADVDVPASERITVLRKPFGVDALLAAVTAALGDVTGP